MIDPLSGAALAGELAGISAGMSGKSLADAWNENVTGSYKSNDFDLNPGISFGYGTKTKETPAISGDTTGSISDSSETDPIDAWNQYVEDEGAEVDASSGGIVSGSNGFVYNYSLLEDGNGDVSAVAPVAVPVDQVYVAIGKALGVAMDVAEISPALGNKMANALVAAGLVYDTASGLVTAWWDGVNMLFPKKAVDAMTDVFEEEGIAYGGQESGAVTSDILAGEYPTGPFVPVRGTGTGTNTTAIVRHSSDAIEARYATAGNAAYELFASSNNTATIWSDQWRWSEERGIYLYQHGDPFQASLSSVTIDGKTAYYTTYANGSTLYDGLSIYFELPPLLASGDSPRKIAWSLVYGTISADYPSGTESSSSPAYAPSAIPSAGGIATSPTTTEEVVAINLPTDPTNTIGDTTDPITGTTTPEQQQKLPYPPIPLPIPDTSPSNPTIPLTNPTIINQEMINELVEDLATTVDPQPPQSSGIIAVPELPNIGGVYPSIIPQSGPGFIHVYNPTPAEFVSFGTWLWVTYADATLDKILNNPFDGVIGAHELYATPARGGSDNIRSAFLTCPTTAALVPNRYTEIDCGTVIIPEFYGNYLDYSPYSQAYIYLPFIGINEVSIDDIIGHAVKIIYRVDSYSGSCIAMIFVAKNNYQNLCYQFAGSCSVEVPMAGGSQAAIKAGMMQAEAYSRAGMGSAMGSILTGVGSLLLGSVGGLMGGVGSAINSALNARAGVQAARVANKATVQHSGQFGSSHGAMGQKKPFIIIRNPVQVKVTNYNEDYGFPAHKRVIIGGCTGYLRVREVNVISAHATDNEKKMIEALLKNGVYVS